MRYSMLGIVAVSLLLIGADFWTPRIEGYRIWIGPDENNDWIDVCCKYTDKGELLWADYTPIEEVEIIRTKNNKVSIAITKSYSLWNLTLPIGDTRFAILQRIRPIEQEFKP